MSKYNLWFINNWNTYNTHESESVLDRLFNMLFYLDIITREQDSSVQSFTENVCEFMDELDHMCEK